VRLLEQMGYRSIGHYAGGIREWRRANLPFDIGPQRSIRTEERKAIEEPWPVL